MNTFVYVLFDVKGRFIIPRLGGATSSENPYNSRKSPYLRKRFFTRHFILPKNLENIDDPKVFAPL